MGCVPFGLFSGAINSFERYSILLEIEYDLISFIYEYIWGNTN